MICLKNIWRHSGNIKANFGSVQVTIKCGIGLDFSRFILRIRTVGGIIYIVANILRLRFVYESGPLF